MTVLAGFVFFVSQFNTCEDLERGVGWGTDGPYSPGISNSLNSHSKDYYKVNIFHIENSAVACM